MKRLTILITFLFAISPVAAQDSKSMGPREEALISNAFQGNLEDVKIIVGKGTSIDVIGPDGRTPLMWAAVNGHTPVVDFLIEKGAKVNVKDNDGQTALMYASRKSNVAAAKSLLKSGADVNVRSYKGAFTALIIAAGAGDAELVQLLLQHGADKEIAERKGRTALDVARQYGYSDVATLLEDAPEPASNS